MERKQIVTFKKTKIAVKMFKEKTKINNVKLIVAGGVAANKTIRDSLKELCKELNVHFSAPPIALCTDNGLMIAYAGAQIYLGGSEDNMSLSPRPRWPIDMDNQKSHGFGKRGRKV